MVLMLRYCKLCGIRASKGHHMSPLTRMLILVSLIAIPALVTHSLLSYRAYKQAMRSPGKKQ